MSFFVRDTDANVPDLMNTLFINCYLYPVTPFAFETGTEIFILQDLEKKISGT